jgi:hypothetical protein
MYRGLNFVISELGCDTKPSHVQGQYGRASMFPAPSYGLQPSEGWTVPPNKHCPILSCNSGWWCLSKECEAPGLDIQCVVDRSGACETES